MFLTMPDTMVTLILHENDVISRPRPFTHLQHEKLDVGEVIYVCVLVSILTYYTRVPSTGLTQTQTTSPTSHFFMLQVSKWAWAADDVTQNEHHYRVEHGQKHTPTEFQLNPSTLNFLLF